MYSLTFCVCVMSPEPHHWKPAVQAVAVMLRTPPSTASYRPASHAHFPYMVRNFENAPITRRALTLCRHITKFALCCHSNATRAPIANLPNCAQLGSSHYYFHKLHPGPCNSVGIRPWTDRQTHTQTDTQTHVTTIYFASSMTHTKCNNTTGDGECGHSGLQADS